MMRVFRAEQGFPTTPNVPTYAPLPIPESGAFDDDTICISINKTWARRVADVLSYLDQPDVWDGSENEIWDARDEAKKIMGVLRSEDGNCVPEEPVDAIIDIRFNAQQNIEYTRDGIVWNVMTPRLVPNYEPLDRADINFGRANLPPIVIRPPVGEVNGTLQMFSQAPNGGTYPSAYIRSTTPNAPLDGELFISAGLPPANEGTIRLRTESGEHQIGFFDHIPTGRKTVVGEIPLGPVYELAQAMLQYGLIGGAIVGVDPEPPGDSPELLMDVTMGEDCHLEIWRFDGETPVIWRSIDLRACLARYSPTWMFESLFIEGHIPENEQWILGGGTISSPQGLWDNDEANPGGSNFIGGASCQWEWDERHPIKAIEILYYCEAGSSWDDNSIALDVDYDPVLVETDPERGINTLMRWEAPDGIFDAIAIRIRVGYHYDNLVHNTPRTRVLSCRIFGTGDEITELS